MWNLFCLTNGCFWKPITRDFPQKLTTFNIIFGVTIIFRLFIYTEVYRTVTNPSISGAIALYKTNTVFNTHYSVKGASYTVVSIAVTSDKQNTVFASDKSRKPRPDISNLSYHAAFVSFCCAIRKYVTSNEWFRTIPLLAKDCIRMFQSFLVSYCILRLLVNAGVNSVAYPRIKYVQS